MELNKWSEKTFACICLLVRDHLVDDGHVGCGAEALYHESCNFKKEIREFRRSKSQYHVPMGTFKNFSNLSI